MFVQYTLSSKNWDIYGPKQNTLSSPSLHGRCPKIDGSCRVFVSLFHLALEPDLGQSDVTVDPQGVKPVQGLQSVVELQQMLVVHCNLEAIWFYQNDHFKTGVRSKGEEGDWSLLISPAALFMVPYNSVSIGTKVESGVHNHGDFMGLVMVAMLDVY